MQLPLPCLLKRMVLLNKASISEISIAWEPVPGSDQIWLCQASLKLEMLPTQTLPHQSTFAHSNKY